MHRRQFLKRSLQRSLGAACLAAALPRSLVKAQSRAAVRADGPVRALPAAGMPVIDGKLVTCDHPWQLPTGLRAAFQNSGLGLLRYPGSQIADIWDWQTGWLDPNAALIPFLNPDLRALQSVANCHYPLSDLAGLNCALIFTPSLACKNLRLNGQPNMPPVQAAAPSLTHCLAGIQAARQAGMRVAWVELGDAFSHSTDWHSSLGQKLLGGEPEEGASAYPQVAAQWANALRQAQPDLKIAFHGSPHLQSPAEPLLAGWNQAAWEGLAQEASLDAMAVQLFLPAHLGIGSGQPNTPWGNSVEQADQYQALRDPQVLNSLFNDADQLLARYLATGAGAGLFQTRFNLLITAFNLLDTVGTLRHTWAHGLAIAALLNAFLREPRVAGAVLHNLADPPHGSLLLTRAHFTDLLLPDATLNLDRLRASLEATPPGIAGRVASLFAQFTSGMSTACALKCDDPDSPLVWGWWSSDNAASRANLLLANLTDEAVTLDSALLRQALPFAPASLPFTIWQAQPGQIITALDSSTYPEFSLTSTPLDATLQDSLILPPYSLSSAQNLRPLPQGKFFMHLPAIRA